MEPGNPGAWLDRTGTGQPRTGGGIPEAAPKVGRSEGGRSREDLAGSNRDHVSRAAGPAHAPQAGRARIERERRAEHALM